MAESIRERVIRLVKDMQAHTVDRGCTPAEAAVFAAKAAEWIERYQIEEAELRAESGQSLEEYEPNICENTIATGKKVFNPGVTRVVDGLARGMSCKVILLHRWNKELGFSEAVYGIIGDQLDTDYVCQIALAVVPALKMMASLEGAEHGYEKAGLIRWSNEYLTGAGEEILKRLEKDRKARSLEKEAALAGLKGFTSNALVVVTGETLAIAKREATAVAVKERYPRLIKVQSRAQYDGTARERGREAGKRIGLHQGIEG